MSRYIDVGGIKKHIIRDGNLIGERNYITFSELDEIPSADVRENVRGEWKHETKHYKDDEQEFYYIETTCSNCGINASKPWQQTNYCWNCGADMRAQDDV